MDRLLRTAAGAALLAMLAACGGEPGAAPAAPGSARALAEAVAAAPDAASRRAARFGLLDHPVECITEPETCNAAAVTYNAVNQRVSHFFFNVVDNPFTGDQAEIQLALDGVGYTGTNLDVVIGPDVISISGTLVDGSGNPLEIVLDVDTGENTWDALFGGEAFESQAPSTIQSVPGSCEFVPIS